MKKYSIVIPTYNHLDDLLKPCLASIFRYTNMEETEIIVSANGCTDNTIEYIKQLNNPNIKLVWSQNALGYTKATNLGIQAAEGEFIVLMNNDTILMPQTKNDWLNLLVTPFGDEKVGITGPVKFDWDCGGITYEAMAFWLVMIKRAVFDKIGILDEIYSPGMGEDGDFCIRAVQAGFSLVSVPNDVTGHFETGIKNFEFPIYHVGNGTFADNDLLKTEVIDRNNKILAEKYGNKGKIIDVTIIIPTYNHFEDAFKPCIDAVLKNTDLSNKEVIVIANGCTDGTREYLNRLSDKISYIWFDEPQGVVRAYNAGIKQARGKYIVTLDNDSILLGQMFDNWIDILKEPFKDPTVGASSPFANDYTGLNLVLHAGCTMYNADILRQIGMFDETYNPGYFSDSDVSMKIWRAGFRCVEVPEYIEDKKYENGVFSINFPVYHTGQVQTMNKFDDIKIVEKNRRILYARYGKKKYSIVIPTYNHCDDLLKPCIESIIKYTDTDLLEIIVVANGCTDNTREYVESHGDFIKLIWVDEGIGYTRATNLGIKAATGEYVIPLNNDTEFLEQEKNYWLKMLEAPFVNPKMGITGILELYDPFAETKFPVFFCVMIPKRLFDEIGLLDEIFSPGYGEDIDFSIRASKAGYIYKCVDTEYYDNGVRCTTYPIWHKNNKTFGEMPEYGSEIVVRNSKILEERYGKKMKKYNVVIPTYNHCDDLLKPLVDSIIKYTDLDNIEFIIVANGCTDNTREYVESLGAPFKLVWSQEAIGYTKATNLGIKECNSEFVILLNNDTELLEQPKNGWLDILSAPFTDEKVGMVGPLEMFDRYSNHNVLIFFCVMIRKKLFDELGLLDEIYSPGGGEDIDFTIKAQKAGYKTLPTSIPTYTPSAGTNVGDFPIWHKDNQTFKDIPEYTKSIIKINGLLNCKRYNNNIKLNLGAGGIDYPGFLSVDLYDKRANIPMDITKLDFKDNSAAEIMASHVFEHLNPYHSISILQEWLRVLKPGGKLAMEMPDIEALCKSFLASTNYYEKMGVLNAIYGSVNTTSEGGPDEITSPHLFGWWPESLFGHLQAAGYIDISFPPEQWPHPHNNLRVEAYKPALKIDREGLRAQDKDTFREIFEDDSYGLTINDIRGKTVIDIGGNIGLFSLACVEKGANRVIAVEAQPVIFNLGLLNNVAGYTAIEPLNYAVSDTDGEMVHILNNNVGSVVGGSEGELTETITLATLLDKYNVNGNDLVMKIDCEGSEFNILLTSSTETLRRFAVMSMEVHANTNHNPAYHDISLIEAKMIECGFSNVRSGRIFNDYPDGTRIWMDVYINKWVRV
jgi:FkbM family methyltransferase